MLVIGAYDDLGALIVEEASASGIEAHLAAVDQAVNELRSHKGVQHLVLAATDTRTKVGYDDLARINLDIPQELFAAACESGYKTFTYISQAFTGPRPRTEVEQTLHDAEILLRGLANRSDGPLLAILRPSLIYGFEQPESQPWLTLPPILSLTFDLVPGLSGGPRMHWIHAHDVARAAVHIAELKKPPKVETYDLADDSPVTVGEFATLLIEAYGYPLGIKLPLPSSAQLIRAVTLAERRGGTQFLDAFLGRRWKKVIKRYALDTVFRPVVSELSLHRLVTDSVVNRASLDKTGFELTYPDIREGMKETINRYQTAGYLPRPGRPRRSDRAEVSRLQTRFSETMRGRCVLSEDDGDWRDIEFTATLSTPKVALPIQDHTWNFDGTMTLEGIAEDVSAQGTLEISLLKKRRLNYEFGFTADDGRQFRLMGVKNVTLSRPFESFTEMKVTIFDDRGGEFATGKMSFDLKKDIGSFVRSFGVRL
jgi:nucleoside-diphosphate-sugar epimerase